MHFVSEKNEDEIIYIENNECNKAEQEHFSQKKIQENVFLLNWKAHEKIQALLKEKTIYSKKSLTSLLHQAIQLKVLMAALGIDLYAYTISYWVHFSCVLIIVEHRDYYVWQRY